MLILLQSFNSSEEARLVQGLLKNHDIESVVREFSANSVFPSLEENEGGALLYVAPDAFSKAEEILRERGE